MIRVSAHIALFPPTNPSETNTADSFAFCIFASQYSSLTARVTDQIAPTKESPDISDRYTLDR